jgi:hypothetical protein
MVTNHSWFLLTVRTMLYSQTDHIVKMNIARNYLRSDEQPRRAAWEIIRLIINNYWMRFL